MGDPGSIEIVHEPARHRFAAVMDGAEAELVYRQGTGVMELVHTEVPPALEGRGIASKLVDTAFAYVRANGLKVVPVCTYVQAWVKRHPEQRDVVAGG